MDVTSYSDTYLKMTHSVKFKQRIFMSRQPNTNKWLMSFITCKGFLWRVLERGFFHGYRCAKKVNFSKLLDERLLRGTFLTPGNFNLIEVQSHDRLLWVSEPLRSDGMWQQQRTWLSTHNSQAAMTTGRQTSLSIHDKCS